MSLYPITVNSDPVISDVNQIIDFLRGNHDLGTVVLPYAMNAPSTSGFSLSLSSGTALGAGAYSYVFTLITGYYKSDGATFNKTGETLASSALNITTTSGNQAVTITLPTTGFPSYAYQIGIYRTAVGGSTYGLVATVKIGNTSYIDTKADGNLGAAPPSTNNTGTKLYIDSWTAPNQPIFTCTPPNTFTGLAANVETTIPYDSTVGFSNGIYTAPMTGRYLFNPHLYGNITNGSVSMNVYLNGSFIYLMAKYVNFSTSAAEFVFSPMVIFGLNAGDTVKFTATATVSNTVNNASSPVAVAKLA